MTQPRHLWSGDWRRESAEAAERFAMPRDLATEPAEVTPDEPAPHPSGPSILDRIRATLGNVDAGRLRRNLLLGLGLLLTAGAAFAAVSALRSSGPSSSRTAHKSSAGNAAPGWLGVDLANFPLAGGALVIDVAPGGPADAAGLRPGDVITSIDNRQVQSPADVGPALAGLRAGQHVQITYQEGLSSYTTQVTLRARPGGP